MSPFERFIAKVHINVGTGCWEWHAYTDRKGYGRMLVGSRTDGSRTCAYSHRFSYAHFREPIPPGLTIHHTCHTPRCVNPYHMELMTNEQNAKESYRRNGHPNYRIHDDGTSVNGIPY